MVTETPVSSLRNGYAVAYLYETYANAVSSSTQAAALQVAIWEVLNETSSSFDVSAGYFSISKNNQVARAATDMLSGLPGQYAPQTVLMVLASPCKQDLLIGTDVPVPEPMSAAIFTVLGLPLLRRRAKRLA